jgi:hypothetical protein
MMTERGYDSNTAVQHAGTGNVNLQRRQRKVATIMSPDVTDIQTLDAEQWSTARLDNLQPPRP